MSVTLAQVTIMAVLITNRVPRLPWIRIRMSQSELHKCMKEILGTFECDDKMQIIPADCQDFHRFQIQCSGHFGKHRHRIMFAVYADVFFHNGIPRVISEITPSQEFKEWKGAPTALLERQIITQIRFNCWKDDDEAKTKQLLLDYDGEMTPDKVCMKMIWFDL